MNRSIASFYADSKRFCEAMNCTYNPCPAQGLKYCPGSEIRYVKKEDIEEFLKVLDEWLKNKESRN